MPMQKTLQCPKCDRKFAREGHLARHLNSIHGMGGAKKKKKMMKRGKKRMGRPKGSKNKSSRKSSSGVFSGMSLEQLTTLISNARAEAQKRWKNLKSMFKNM
jgi:uncharacterized C2H2 Zn-finger protein